MLDLSLSKSIFINLEKQNSSIPKLKGDTEVLNCDEIIRLIRESMELSQMESNRAQTQNYYPVHRQITDNTEVEFESPNKIIPDDNPGTFTLTDYYNNTNGEGQTDKKETDEADKNEEEENQNEEEDEKIEINKNNEIKIEEDGKMKGSNIFSTPVGESIYKNTEISFEKQNMQEDDPMVNYRSVKRKINPSQEIINEVKSEEETSELPKKYSLRSSQLIKFPEGYGTDDDDEKTLVNIMNGIEPANWELGYQGSNLLVYTSKVS